MQCAKLFHRWGSLSRAMSSAGMSRRSCAWCTGPQSFKWFSKPLMAAAFVESRDRVFSDLMARTRCGFREPGGRGDLPALVLWDADESQARFRGSRRSLPSAPLPVFGLALSACAAGDGVSLGVGWPRIRAPGAPMSASSQARPADRDKRNQRSAIATNAATGVAPDFSLVPRRHFGRNAKQINNLCRRLARRGA